MIEIENYHSPNTTVNYYRQKPLTDAKINRQKYDKKQDIYKASNIFSQDTN